MSDAKRRKKARRVRTALIVLCVILSIILTAIIGVYIYIDHMLGQLNYVTDHTTLSTDFHRRYLCFIKNYSLNSLLKSIRKLVSVTLKNLYSVIFTRVM